MIFIVAALIVAGTLAWAVRSLGRDLQAGRSRGGATAHLLQTFAPGIAAAQADPRALLVWQPLARAARQIFPDEFAALDKASGGEFPFTKAAIEAAHSRWTADWLAWERSHDAECKAKAAVAEHELAASGGSPVMRARLESIEREKLESYQRRYEEYIRVAKSIQALIPG